MTQSARPVVLASGSPRRQALFKALGIRHQVVVPRVREIREDRLRPDRLVKKNALLKAKAVARKVATGVIVAADTLVVSDGRFFGKPRHMREAEEMLRHLSGKTHRVYTGLCVLDVDRGQTFLDVASTRVTMRRLSSAQIDLYLRRVSVWDKAGAYAVQDVQGMLIDRLEGSLSNVVGLPLDLVERRLRECGII